MLKNIFKNCPAIYLQPQLCQMHTLGKLKKEARILVVQQLLRLPVHALCILLLSEGRSSYTEDIFMTYHINKWLHNLKIIQNK